MEQILTEWKRFLLTESSLSRIYQHIVENECAIITAFRNDLDHISVCDESAVTGQQNNQERNRDLKAALLSSGYGVTFVDGAFIENYGNEYALPSFIGTNIPLAGSFALGFAMGIKKG